MDRRWMGDAQGDGGWKMDDRGWMDGWMEDGWVENVLVGGWRMQGGGWMGQWMKVDGEWVDDEWMDGRGMDGNMGTEAGAD